ncbi:TOBE domain-containing protein [Candidatus Nitrotoga arctica]|uniref:Molybdate-binding domain of ModE n=1 Tax=Candidatus Nitrotoga arctica TaxID=453162 RepID=A0ABM8Z171_9PROT|nr:TOBE domain-containing protein [Candidatus Nitrotoga arctica]CAG9933615.1 Molybdate-binding domain of ModE [Candidatus Nitrotoga arctica]
MKTSARNQFQGKVTNVKQGSVNDEVELEVAGGKIVAIVTHESADGLGLQVGAKAFALIKSSSIIIATDNKGAKFSARNSLNGTISQVKSGAVNSEVIIGLEGGASVAAIVTNESCKSLGLAVGMPATAIFKASSVIIGTQT